MHPGELGCITLFNKRSRETLLEVIEIQILQKIEILWKMLKFPELLLKQLILIQVLKKLN